MYRNKTIILFLVIGLLLCAGEDAAAKPRRRVNKTQQDPAKQRITQGAAIQQITPLSPDDYESLLDTLDNIEPVYFRYNIEVEKQGPSARMHIGLLPGEAPDIITDEKKTGLPTSDAIAFLLAVTKAQQGELDLLSETAWGERVKEAGVTKEGDLIFRNDTEDRGLIFEVNQDGEYVEVMRIDGESGNVGIGVASPSATLDVNGTIKISGSDSDWTTDRFGKGLLMEQGNAILWGKGEGAAARGILVTEDKLSFVSSDTEDGFSNPRYDIVIDENGNVGIGTADTEKYRLSVNGSMYTEGIIVSSGGYAGYTISTFRNGSGGILKRGDVVKIKANSVMKYMGKDYLIPVPEVTLTENDNEYGVVGVVLGKNNAGAQEVTSTDTAATQAGDYVEVVTGGTFSLCRVTGAVETGSLLVSSFNGYAKQSGDGENNIVAMALESYDPGISKSEYIAVLLK